MRKSVLSIGVFLGLLAQAGYSQQLTPSFEYVLPATNAVLVIQRAARERPEEHDCGGPTMVRTLPSDLQNSQVPDTIPTEMVAMELTCDDRMMVMLNPSMPSRGSIMPSAANHQMYDSFFDVFVEVMIGGITLRNTTPIRMVATIAKIPPYGSKYFSTAAVDLVTTAGQTAARLLSVRHEVGFPPESLGEFSNVFSCFYECKPYPTNQYAWQELTTLMLVNQRAVLPDITALMLFVNGKEQPIAKAFTVLSPEDLDEVNVCATLSQLVPSTVPPAGIVEVVLLPTGGVFGWVKNLTGGFLSPEPFDSSNTVTGIAKTECRVAGPNVVLPNQILKKIANSAVPTVIPVLVEETEP